MNKAATLDVIIRVRKKFRTEIQRRAKQEMDREELVTDIRKAIERVAQESPMPSHSSPRLIFTQ